MKELHKNHLKILFKLCQVQHTNRKGLSLLLLKLYISKFFYQLQSSLLQETPSIIKYNILRKKVSNALLFHIAASLP